MFKDEEPAHHRTIFPHHNPRDGDDEPHSRSPLAGMENSLSCLYNSKFTEPFST